MRTAVFVFLLAAPVAAQNLAEPQYQLTGKDYRTEAPAIQQMFYNVAGMSQAQNATNAALLKAVNSISVSSGGTTSSLWSSLTGFPAGCVLPQVVTAVGTTLTCQEPTTISASITEAQVTNLVTDLAAIGASTSSIYSALNSTASALTNLTAAVSVTTNAIASGSATTYLHVDGSNYMTGQLTGISSMTISDNGAGGLLLVNDTMTITGTAGVILGSTTMNSDGITISSNTPIFNISGLNRNNTTPDGAKILITAGADTLSAGASLSLTGTPASTHNGGTALLSGGIGNGSIVNQAYISAAGGSLTQAGNLDLYAGQAGGANGSTNAGVATLNGGANISSSVGRPGGDVHISGGSATTNNVGGNVVINAGIGSSGNGNIQFAVGNVGINTSTPGTLLDVNGSETIRGQLTVASSSATIQGPLEMSSNFIHDVTDPVLNQDAATKHYADAGVTTAVAAIVTTGFVRDNLLGQVTGSQKNFTLTYAPSPNSERVVLNGLVLSGTSDYTLTGTALALTTAPAITATEFNVQYATGASGAGVPISTSGFWGSGNYPAGLTVQINFGTCYGSTFTATFTGQYPLEVDLTGTGIVGGNEALYATVLMDGAPLDIFSSSFPQWQDGGNGTPTHTFSTVYQTASAPSAGLHHFCVTVWNNTANEAYMSCGTGPCWMRILEARHQ